MESFRACALVACACLLVAAPRAAAQQPAPRSTPLPSIASEGVVAASYNLPHVRVASNGPLLTGTEPPAVTEPVPQMIDGSGGTTQFEQAVHSGCPTCGPDPYNGYGSYYGEGYCDSCNTCGYGAYGCGCGSRWVGTLGGLVMGRSRANAYTTTLDGGGVSVLNTQSAGADWTGGWEINAGYISEAGPGVLFTYWGLAPMEGYAEAVDPGNSLSSPINDGGFFQNSAEQNILRNDQAENYELSLLVGAYSRGHWTMVPFAGFRYFRFDESLRFGALQGGGDPGTPSDWNYYRSQNINNLYGGQFGALINYQFGGRFGWYLTPKVGLYGNQMTGRYRNYIGDGTTNYEVIAHKSNFALLGEVNTGINYFLRENVFIYAGYRVVGVTNVALGDDQLQTDLSVPTGLSDLRQSGSLILHGVMIGGGWLF